MLTDSIKEISQQAWWDEKSEGATFIELEFPSKGTFVKPIKVTGLACSLNSRIQNIMQSIIRRMSTWKFNL